MNASSLGEIGRALKYLHSVLLVILKPYSKRGEMERKEGIVVVVVLHYLAFSGCIHRDCLKGRSEEKNEQRAMYNNCPSCSTLYVPYIVKRPPVVQ